MGPQSATVTLRPDGTGSVQIALLGEQPVSWTEEEGRVRLQLSGAGQTGSGAQGGAPAAAGTAITGTLSEDRNTLTIPFGGVTLRLQRQAETK